MARFLQILFSLLLLATAGTTAYLNYITVEAGKVLVLVEKTSGVRPKPLPAGDHWIWGVSIPGKFSLHSVTIEEQTLDITINRSIIDAAYMQLGDDFNLIVPLRVTIKIEAERAVALFRTLGSDFKNLPTFILRQLTPYISLKYRELNNTAAAANLVRDQFQIYIQENLTAGVSEQLNQYGIKVTSLALNPLKDLQVPVLSAQLKAAYQEYDDFLKKKKAEVLKRISDLAEIEALKRKDARYIAHLKKLGPVLQQYPELASYIAMEKLGPRARVVFADLARAGRFLDYRSAAASAGQPDAADSSAGDSSNPAEADEVSADGSSAEMPAFKYKPEP